MRLTWALAAHSVICRLAKEFKWLGTKTPRWSRNSTILLGYSSWI